MLVWESGVEALATLFREAGLLDGHPPGDILELREVCVALREENVRASS